MVYVPQVRKTLLFGGLLEEENLDDLWQWDGWGWTQLEPADPFAHGAPGARHGASLVMQDNSESVLLFGGAATGALNDLWEWRAGHELRPGLALRVHWPAAGVPVDRIHSIDARWRVGGRGFWSDQPEDGCTLLAWDEIRWREVKTSPSGLDELGELTWTCDNANRIERLIFGAEEMLYLAVTPAAPNGTEGSALALDYVEVGVWYQSAQ